MLQTLGTALGTDNAKLHQADLTKEKEERARIVLTLRETIAAMRQAGQLEADLRQELVDLQEQLAHAQSSEVYQDGCLEMCGPLAAGCVVAPMLAAKSSQGTLNPEPFFSIFCSWVGSHGLYEP